MSAESPARAERLARFEAVDVYPVVTEAFAAGRASLEVLDAVLEGGARVVQLREKALSDRALFELAVAFRERTARAGALLVVDDRLDVALAAGADGVHLGQGDLPIAVARRLAPDLLVGASTHSLEEALEAERAGADTVNLGPIYATSTKETVVAPLGLETLRAVSPRLAVPFTVMGGIKARHVPELVAAGARRFAVVTAITAAADPAAATRELGGAIRAALARHGGGLL